MRQVKIPKDAQKDPLTHLRIWGILVGKFIGRNRCRTPMQWNSSPINAGFSSDPNVEPWLPISPDSAIINVKCQKNDEKSTLTFYKQLLQFRKHETALTEGMLKLFRVKNKDCLVYERYTDLDRVLVFLNFKKKVIQAINPYPSAIAKFSTHDLNITSETYDFIKLRPLEGLIIKYTS